MIAANGKVGFSADVLYAGSTSTTNTGLFSTNASGAVNLIIREGDTVSGNFLNNLANARGPVYNAEGKWVFVGNTSTSPSGNVLVSTASSPPAMYIRQGSAVPGYSGYTFSGINVSPAVSSSGVTAMFTFITNGTALAGIWTDAGGSYAPVAMQGSTAAGTDATFTWGAGTYVTINPSNVIAFAAALTGGTSTSSNNSGIWTASGGTVSLAVRAGDTAPGTGGLAFGAFASTTSNSALPVGINKNGHLAFSAPLAGASTSNDSGIWANVGGSLTLVAREGSTAPGAITSTFFSNLNSTTTLPSLSDTGRIAFAATLKNSASTTTTSSYAIYSWDSANGLKIVAQSGQAAPGAGGAVFGNFNTATNLPVINTQGRIAFYDTLTGTGITSGVNDAGIWYENDAGTLTLLIRKGDLFTIAEGDVRTISGIGFVTSNFTGAGGSDGRGTSFASTGSIVFSLTFTDGTSGVFVSTVPEPPSIVALSAAGLGLFQLARRRWRRAAVPEVQIT